MIHIIARDEGVEKDVQIMRMHYETAGFDLTGRGKILTKNCPLYITRAYRANGPVSWS
jgi:hypothetical protein